MREVQEGEVTIEVPEEEKISRKLSVFYNPAMRSNRDLTLLFLRAWGKKGLRAVDLMAGSGIRSARLVKELPEDTFESLVVNDANPSAVELAKNNLERNGCELDKVIFSNKTADALLAGRGAYEYIDVDPFGSPNPFLDLAIKKILPGGVLAITATDTAPLCGTYPKACERKYWAIPRRGPEQHEFALRILIRKIQLVAAQYEKALVPLCSIARQHYVRVFFEVRRGKKRVDDLLAQHQMIGETGPFWMGSLQEPDLVEKMADSSPKYLKKFLDTLAEEARIDIVGIIDLHQIAKQLKSGLPKLEKTLLSLREAGFQASRTIFSDKAIRTTASKEEVKKKIKELTSRDSRST